MKIVHLTPSFWPHVGGVETHVAEISQQMVAAGHEVQILTIQDSPSQPLNENVKGCLVSRCPVGDRPTRSWSYKFTVWKWIWQQRRIWWRADVIQTHDVFWWLLPWFPLIEKRLFITFHGWEGVYPVRKSAKLQRLVGSWLAAGTLHVGDWIQELYWDLPNAVTYGGVHPPAIKPVSTSLQLKKVVFFGRLSAENEIEKYLELFKKLKKSFPNLSITWIGDGPLKNQCSKIGFVTGMVSQPEKYLRSADVVAASSYLSLLTAQSYGKLCLGFYSHHLKQRYLETYPGSDGMLIAQSPADLYGELMHLMNDPVRYQKLVQVASSHARKNRWEDVLAVYEKLWDSKDELNA